MIGPQTTIRLVNDVHHKMVETTVRLPAWLAFAGMCETIEDENPDDPCTTCAVLRGGEITLHFHPTRSDEEFLAAMEREIEREAEDEAEAAGGVE